jgi:hypothetical protein
MTNAHFVSSVITDAKRLGADGPISKQYVLEKGRDIAKTLIKQESDNRRLFKMMELFTSVECLPLEAVSPAECCDIFLDCSQFVRSQHPLPELYPTSYGSILRVFTIDGRKEFTQTTPHDYQYTLHRSFQNKNKGYFWINTDRRLVIPNEDLVAVKISGMFISPMEVRSLIDSSVEKDHNGYCKGPLDDVFICPGHLAGTVRQETTKDVYAFMMKGLTIMDNKPDGNVQNNK